MKKKILLGVLLLAPVFLSSTHKNRENKLANVAVDNELQKDIAHFIRIISRALYLAIKFQTSRDYYQSILDEINNENRKQSMTREKLENIKDKVLAHQRAEFKSLMTGCCNSNLCRVATKIFAGVSMYGLGSYFQSLAESGNFVQVDAKSPIVQDFAQPEASGSQIFAADEIGKKVLQLENAGALLALPGVSLYRRDSKNNPVLKFDFAKSNSDEMATLNRLVNQGVLPEGTLGVFADSDDHPAVEAIVYAEPVLEPVMHDGYNHCKLASTEQIICTKNNCKLFLEPRVRCARDNQADL